MNEPRSIASSKESLLDEHPLARGAAVLPQAECAWLQLLSDLTLPAVVGMNKGAPKPKECACVQLERASTYVAGLSNTSNGTLSRSYQWRTLIKRHALL